MARKAKASAKTDRIEAFRALCVVITERAEDLTIPAVEGQAPRLSLAKAQALAKRIAALAADLAAVAATGPALLRHGHDARYADAAEDHRFAYSPRDLLIVGKRMVNDYNIADALADYMAMHPEADRRAVHRELIRTSIELGLSDT